MYTVGVGVRLEDLHEEWPDEAVTPVDRLPVSVLTERQRRWREEGTVVLPGFMPNDVIDAYCDEWLSCHEPGSKGWGDCTPYMRNAALRRLCCWGPLAEVLEEVVGEPMGVHLNLSGWVSTLRDWHSDQYLNEPFVGGFYAAVWVALDDIHPDAGPFEWVPRSHLWSPLSQVKVLGCLDEGERGPWWPVNSERLLTPLFEEKIAVEGHEVKRFLAKKGDVLVWHGRLVHRGSRPVDPLLERRSIISHYSGVSHRPDFPSPLRAPRGGFFFPILQSGPVF